jgi:twinkle protein
MAVYQETGIGAISLPNGANHLPLEVLPWLEKYDRIYLWMDSDEVGRTAAEKFAHKLGIKRTFIVNCLKDDAQGPKDANDALKQGRDVQKYIRESRPLVQENIQTFRDLRENVIKRLLNYEENKGINSDSFSWFNSKIKGIEVRFDFI